jgi:predicted RNA-binding protein with PUA-like domain
MNHWLMKTEPDDFSIDDLARVKREPWSGVRNYQARNHLRAAQVGDLVLIYHSSCAVPAVAGIAKVARAAYPDPTQFDRKSDYYDPKSPKEDPRWTAVEVQYVRKLKRPVPLEQLKRHAAELGDFALLHRGNRLSVLPVTRAQYDAILALERVP